MLVLFFCSHFFLHVSSEKKKHLLLLLLLLLLPLTATGASIALGQRQALHPAGPQFGGHVVNYENRLSFATVHAAGHMVPQFMPLKGSRLLAQLLFGDTDYPFAPPLPTDEELEAMSADEFNQAIDSWTDTAKAYVDQP